MVFVLECHVIRNYYMQLITGLRLGIISNGNDVDIIHLDFHKAFDCVLHQHLLSKLKSNGISGIVLNWITDFLSNRQQRVKVNGSYSEQSNVTNGVPQESVLGPILFIIYINNLTKVAQSNIAIFADDTKLNRYTITSEDILANGFQLQ